MDGVTRREKILHKILKSDNPLTGAYLSEVFDVSRQVIVQDIALLRAAGNNIIATPQGYIYPKLQEERPQRTIACDHCYEGMRDELTTIVDLGGTIIDVIIEHAVYGEFKGQLMIKSRKDVDKFISKMKEADAEPLSALTEGVHIHTIEAGDEDTLDLIESKLAEKDILLKES